MESCRRTDFVDKQETSFQKYDVGYLNPELPRATLKQALKHYVASAVIYGGALFILTISPWFRDLLNVGFYGCPAYIIYRYLYVSYLVITPFVYFIFRPRSLWISKNLRIAGYFGRLIRWCLLPRTRQELGTWRPTYEEKHAMMFLLIKMFYGPLMINSAFGSYNMLLPALQRLQHTHQFSLEFIDKGYVFLFHGVFLLDASMFAFGYHSESWFLRNKLRYAETNPLHILVCIACYSPFNMATGAFFGPSYQNPYILFSGDIMHPMTWVLRGLGVFFLLLLLSSSLSMFTRASNLTNRGIVDWGPYRIIRHPGYFAKNMFWLMTLIPAFVPNKADPYFAWPAYILYCATIVWGFLGWGTLYFLRSITEERFLMRDPDYVAYCKKVRYRFIPWVY